MDERPHEPGLLEPFLISADRVRYVDCCDDIGVGARHDRVGRWRSAAQEDHQWQGEVKGAPAARFRRHSRLRLHRLVF
ncbi:hypothetical protein X737_14130 [Mesorhizobium sp. L48C026A00]|nr:hypothetical protein X737_14130 [Mesorhizobium sp. L48C026A00]